MRFGLVSFGNSRMSLQMSSTLSVTVLRRLDIGSGGVHETYDDSVVGNEDSYIGVLGVTVSDLTIAVAAEVVAEVFGVEFAVTLFGVLTVHERGFKCFLAHDF